jgi:N-terminal domain of toast_rack, DUF2154/Domain of unknown function (DUF5668)
MAQNQRPPLVVPIILIVVGALFLYANYRPGFAPWPIIRTYWPLILIFFGLGKMWDATHRARSGDPNAPPGTSVGGTIAIVAVVLVLFALFWRGRVFSRDSRSASSWHHEVRTVDLQNAKSVSASLRSSGGEVTVSGGSSRLLDADFSYGDSYVSPTVDYNVDSGHGRLNITQDDQTAHFMGSHNTWNVHFSNNVPLELKVDIGAGEGRFHLHDVPLTNFTLEMGAGHVEVDLTGGRKKDLDADLEGGVGQATIRLPRNVGVIVHASGGIGAVDAHGLRHDGDEYTNEAYGKTPATIRLRVEGGVGEISLIQEP